MLSAAVRRVSRIERRPRIEFFEAHIFDWRPPLTHYDRIVTHFDLDLYKPYRMRRMIEKISCLATEDTLWINVDFRNANQLLRQKLLMWAQYRFFRICAGIEAPRLYDSAGYIRKAGWQTIEKRILEQGWISAHLMSNSIRYRKLKAAGAVPQNLCYQLLAVGRCRRASGLVASCDFRARDVVQLAASFHRQLAPLLPATNALGQNSQSVNGVTKARCSIRRRAARNENPATMPTRIATSERRNSPMGGRKSDSLVLGGKWLVG
jgi:hypothetical protein